MIVRRRTVMSVLPAAAAAAAVPATQAHARTNITEARSVSYVPAAALPDGERSQHERYMAEALAMVEMDEGPPHASVIVDRRQDRIVCRGHNRSRESRVYHGEIVALLNCAKVEPRVDWQTLTLYTTAEPCPMCMTAIIWNRIPEVVFGTSVETLIELGFNQFRLDSPMIAAAAPFYSGRIIGGVLRERADNHYAAWAIRRRG